MSVLGVISQATQVVMPIMWPGILLDRRMARDASLDTAPAPVFLIGPPRTGTTILYQRLLTHYRFTYPSNMDAALFTMPSLAHCVSRRFKDRIRFHGDSSDYGYVAGMWGASEAGPMMRYFLDNESRREMFGNAVRYVSAASGLPFLCKNTLNSVRLPAIFEALPNAFVVRTHRDREATARSILKMRRHNGDETEWAGVKPDGYEAVLDQEPIEQTRWQYDAVQARIDNDLRAVGHQAFDVVYEEFVADPPGILGRLVAEYEAASGMSVELTGISIPDKMQKPG